MAKTRIVTVGTEKRLRDIKEVERQVLLDSRMGERETLRMALKIHFDLGRLENLDTVLWFWDRKMTCSAWNMLNVRFLWDLSQVGVI